MTITVQHDIDLLVSLYYGGWTVTDGGLGWDAVCYRCGCTISAVHLPTLVAAADAHDELCYSASGGAPVTA